MAGADVQRDRRMAPRTYLRRGGWVGSAPPDQAAGTWGLRATDDFWSGGDPVGAPDLVLAVVPARADPEAVMARVRALR